MEEGDATSNARLVTDLNSHQKVFSTCNLKVAKLNSLDIHFNDIH